MSQSNEADIVPLSSKSDVISEYPRSTIKYIIKSSAHALPRFWKKVLF